MAKKKTAPEFYIVEEGIPMPERIGRWYGGHPVKVYPFKEMRVGDSFLAPPGKKPQSIIKSGLNFSQKRGINMEFEVRAVDGGWRCWRVQ